MNFRKVSDVLEVLKEKNCRNNIQLITLDGKKSGVTNHYDGHFVKNSFGDTCFFSCAL